MGHPQPITHEAAQALAALIAGRFPLANPAQALSLELDERGIDELDRLIEATRTRLAELHAEAQDRRHELGLAAPATVDVSVAIVRRCRP